MVTQGPAWWLQGPPLPARGGGEGQTPMACAQRLLPVLPCFKVGCTGVWVCVPVPEHPLGCHQRVPWGHSCHRLSPPAQPHRAGLPRGDRRCCRPALVLLPVPGAVRGPHAWLLWQRVCLPCLSPRVCPFMSVPRVCPHVSSLCLPPPPVRPCLSPRLFPYVSPPVSPPPCPSPCVCPRPRPLVSVPPCPSPQPLDGARRTGSERRRRAGGAARFGVSGHRSARAGSVAPPVPPVQSLLPLEGTRSASFPKQPVPKSSLPSPSIPAAQQPSLCSGSTPFPRSQMRPVLPQPGPGDPSLGRCAPALLGPSQPPGALDGLWAGGSTPRVAGRGLACAHHQRGYPTAPGLRPLPDLASSPRESPPGCHRVGWQHARGGTPSWGL